jgi:hypothetical protein
MNGFRSKDGLRTGECQSDDGRVCQFEEQVHG